MDDAPFGSVPSEQLEARITELAGHLAAAECRWLEMIAEYDRRRGWVQWGCRSCAYWLSWKCGLDLRTARQKLRVAHALPQFPHIREAFAAGRLTYSKVRALVRCASPTTEADLVAMAERAPAAHLERISRGYGRTEREENGEDPASRRRIEFGDDFEDPELGVMVVHATREEIALVRGVLEAARAERRSLPDALVLMAESYAAHGDGCRTGAQRASLIVVTDESVLVGDDTGDAHLEGGPALPPETVRRLACDAKFRWLLRGTGGTLINVSNEYGDIPRALRRLVRVRDDGQCQFPGCAESRFTEVHHVVHRADGGPNSAANLLTLCWFHHRLVHEGGWSLERDVDTGEVVAISPAGRRITTTVGGSSRQPGDDVDADTIIAANEADGLVIDAGTVVPTWSGDRLDLGWAVTSLWYANHPDRLAADNAKDRAAGRAATETPLAA